MCTKTSFQTYFPFVRYGSTQSLNESTNITMLNRQCITVDCLNSIYIHIGSRIIMTATRCVSEWQNGYPNTWLQYAVSLLTAVRISKHSSNYYPVDRISMIYRFPHWFHIQIYLPKWWTLCTHYTMNCGLNWIVSEWLDVIGIWMQCQCRKERI